VNGLALVALLAASSSSSAPAGASDSAARTREAWAANERAAPAWAAGASRATPQLHLGARDRLPDISPRPVGELEGATIACDVTVRRPWGWDFKGKVDPDVRLAFGLDDTAGVTLSGADNRGRALVTIPGVHLKKGEKLKLSVADRDHGDDDWVGSRLVRFDGRLPVEMKHQLFVARCDLWREDAATEAKRVPLDEALKKLKRALKPKASDRNFGFPRKEDRVVRRLIEDVAAREGWHSERVLALRARYDETLARFSAAAQSEMAKLERKAMRAASPLHTPVEVVEPRVLCDAEAAAFSALTDGADRPCVLRAQLAVGARGLVLQGQVGGDRVARRLAVLTTAGRVVSLGSGQYLLDGAEEPRFVLRLRSNDGATAAWSLALEDGERPALLRVQTGAGKRRFSWVRLVADPAGPEP
jgi:hypothetical protein